MKITWTITKILGISVLFALIILGGLYYSYKTNNSQGKFMKNGGFERKYLSLNLRPVRDYKLPDDFYTIVGYSEGRVILRSSQSNLLMTFDENYSKTTFPLTKIKTNAGSISSVYFNEIDSTLDIACDNDYEFFKYNIKYNRKMESMVFSDYVYKFIRLDSVSLITLSSIGKGENLQEFRKVLNRNGKDSTVIRSAFKVKSMAEEGMLNRYGNKFVYVNYYNNNFYIIDSLLQKRESYNTIDTVQQLPSVELVKNNTILKFVEPPRIVNNLSGVSNDVLYVHSLITASNEKNNFMNKNLVLDLYNLKNGGVYMGTVTWEDDRGKSLQDIFIRDNKLILVYSNLLIIYEYSL